MVKQLRRRICLVLSAVLIVILAVIEGYLYRETCAYQMESEQIFLREIAERARNGVDWTEEGQLFYEELPVYVFRYDDVEGLRMTAGGSGKMEEEINRQAEEILELSETEGKHGGFRYILAEPVLVLYDESQWEEYNGEIIRGMIIVFLLASVVIAGVAVLISGWLTRPVQKAFDQQKQFVSDASHELKTPLAIIGANAQRLNKEIGENQWLGHILQENRRMGKLLEELLTLARMESPAADRECERFDLSRALTGVLLPYESEAFEKGVHFYMDMEEECFVTGREEQLKQAAVILVDNALHHVSDRGSVWVKLADKRERVVIEVSNTGKEIPEEERAKIFQRFYQTDKASGRKENRHGLGLAIADAIARGHKGTLSVDCRDGVTTFYLMIRKN